MKLASFFSGAGGLDLGFEQAGFKVIYSNDNWKGVQKTYESNLGSLDTRSIQDLHPDDIPSVDGFIGGPPCQAWSEAGAMKGENDPRGRAFWDYIRLIRAKRPRFFVAENVKGFLAPRNEKVLEEFRRELYQYEIEARLLDATDYGIPQRRQRVFIVGYHKDFEKRFSVPRKSFHRRPVLVDLFYRLSQDEPRYKGGCSSRFLSRQRVASWEEPSYTIVATERQVPFHPSSPKMKKVGKETFEVQPGSRRLSIPECAAIQGFPMSFDFHYESTADGYKMIGNAVPPGLGKAVADTIHSQLFRYD